MANFPLLKAGGWLLGELLTPAQANALNAMLPKIPNFLEGSSHTPSGIVEVLGSVGMKIATLRGPTQMTHDGANEPSLTLVNNAASRTVSATPATGRLTATAGAKSAYLDGVTGKVMATDGFEFTAGVDITVDVPTGDPIPQNKLTGALPALWVRDRDTSSPFGFNWLQDTVASAHSEYDLFFRIPRLPGGSIKSVQVYRTVGSGHAGLPANMPEVGLYSVDGTTRTRTIVGSATDPSPSVPSYEAAGWHTYTLSSPLPIVQGDAYYIRYRGEAGANALVQRVRLRAVSVTYTTAALHR